MTLIKSAALVAEPEPESPLVSVITPTFPGREKVLLERCIPSVWGQNYPGPIEHVIVTDENPKLELLLDEIKYQRWWQLEEDQVDQTTGARRTSRVVQINDIWKNPAARAGERGLHVTQNNGAWPWFLGSFLGLGQFMSFLGDDDELLSHHVSAHVRAMQTASAMWSLSRIEFRAHGAFWNVIGDESYAEGHLDATGIMCWKDALTIANWDPWAGIAAVDWKLVNDWRQHSLPGIFIPDITGVHHDGWLTGSTGKPYHDPPPPLAIPSP
jgi:hypothetical protein